MVELVVVLTAASMFMEYKIATSVPIVGRVLGRYPIISLLFSLCLSLVLGMFFGAAGLLVMVAGITSTMLMQPVYFLMRTGQIDRLHAVGRQAKAAWNRNWEATQALVSAIGSIFQLVFKLVAFVFGILAFIIKMVGKVTGRLNSIGATS